MFILIKTYLQKAKIICPPPSGVDIIKVMRVVYTSHYQSSAVEITVLCEIYQAVYGVFLSNV